MSCPDEEKKKNVRIGSSGNYVRETRQGNIFFFTYDQLRQGSIQTFINKVPCLLDKVKEISNEEIIQQGYKINK